MSALRDTGYQTPMDEDLIRRLIRLRITDRRLPRSRAIRYRDTSGDGKLCEACDLPVDPNQRAILAMVSLEGMSVRFHVDCCKLWEQEEQALSRNAGDRLGQ